ncbi:hypothetical protein [Roseivirga pacifica]|uniref:hypothetical protein n=1 Tax=Roseivirga pacifica TaxID=1267423 RepID=UPI003BAE8A50
MKKLLLILIAMSLLYSCKEDLNETIPEEAYMPDFEADESTASLTNRVTSSNSEAFSLNSGGNVIQFNKIAEVIPNQVNGFNLSATAVTELDDRVYVTYHIRGEEYGGEILTFDVSNSAQPQLLKSIVDPSADFNDIMMGQGTVNLWVAGARDVSVSGYDNTNGAVALKIPLNGGKLPRNSAAWEAPLASYSASSITRVPPPAGSSNGRIFVTSGSGGGISVIRGNDVDEVFHTRSVSNAKHFDYDNDRGVFLRGNGDGSSSVDIYKLDDSFDFETFTIPYDVTPLGKNGVEVVGDYAYLAMGADGLVKVDLVNKTIVGTYKATGNGLANSVKVLDGLVYLANGSDGLIILDENDLSMLRNYKYDGSCNYVAIEKDLVFVANGSTGGLIILQKQ